MGILDKGLAESYSKTGILDKRLAESYSKTGILDEGLAESYRKMGIFEERLTESDWKRRIFCGHASELHRQRLIVCSTRPNPRCTRYCIEILDDGIILKAQYGFPGVHRNGSNGHARMSLSGNQPVLWR